MLDVTNPLPEDPGELRAFTALLLAEVKSQAVLIEKLRHLLAGHRTHRFGVSSETAEQLQLALEMSEIAIAAMTAKLRPPDDAPAGKPKRKPIPDHIPRIEAELIPENTDCANCGGKLRRLGEDVTEELEYVPGRFIVNRPRAFARHTMICPATPDGASPHGLLGLRLLHAGAAAVAPDRARQAGTGTARPCAGQQIRRSPAALPAKPDIRPRRA
jgi:Transposase C of IS166 homeodomain/zinc-finger binding domain of transposase IS66